MYLGAVDVCRDERRGYFEGEHHGQELELVSNQHGVADDGRFALYRVLDGDGRDVLSTGGNDQL